MNFTGERYIPGQGGFQIACEHIHRYLFALRWAGGKQVLDLACGSGYGSALLAQHARHVWAIDLDENTILGASKDWGGANVSYIRGDAAQLPFRSGSMDLVVAMEALEHIKDQEKLVWEISRVCCASGVALISTPNRAVYSDTRQYVNPFHVKELYLDEFCNLLKQHFAYVQIIGQQMQAGSLLSCNTSKSFCEVITEPGPGLEKRVAAPMYFLAVCSVEQLQESVPAHSAYLDSTDGLMHEAKQEMDKLNGEIEGLGRWARSLEDVISEKDQMIRDLQGRMAKAVEERDQVIRDLQNQMNRRIVDLLDLLHQKEREFDERGQWALSLTAEVEQLKRIHHAFLYRLLSRLGLLPR